jgi:hypothetical protein
MPPNEDLYYQIFEFGSSVDRMDVDRSEYVELKSSDYEVWIGKGRGMRLY